MLCAKKNRVFVSSEIEGFFTPEFVPCCKKSCGNFGESQNRNKKQGMEISMRYNSTVIAVADINAARRFYEDLFGLEVFQDYGKNVAFTCGLALQQDFDWLVNLPKESVCKKSNNMEICFEEQDFDGFLEKLKKHPNIATLGDVMEHSWGQRVIRFYDLDGHMIEVGEEMKMVVNRFLASNMTMEEVSARMDVSVPDLFRLLQS